MEKEGKYIEEKFGRRTPFTVPDGYFDDFASQIMQQLPEREADPTAKVVSIKASWWQRYRKAVVGVAATVCVALAGAGVVFHHHVSQAANDHVAAQSNVTTPAGYSVMDAMADYTMLDSDDMYAYIADAR